MKSINPVLLNKYYSYKEWESAVEKIENTKEQGDAMELFVYYYLSTHSAYYEIKEIYTEDTIPSDLRSKLKLEKKDNGVDGVIVRNDDKTIAYQVKFRSNNATPTARELSTFWAESEYADYRLICANCKSLPKVTDKKRNQMSLLLDSFINLDETFFDGFNDFLNNKIIDTTLGEQEKYTPFSYQNKIINDVANGFSNSTRGKLIAACGVGKTLASMWIQERMNTSSVLFTVPSLALIKQTLESWTKNCNDPFSYLCVCSDNTVVSTEAMNDEFNLMSSEVDFPVTTNPDEIKSFLSTQADKKIVFVTYNSLDAISNAICDFDFSFDLGIFDEAHRTAGTKDSLMFVYGMDDKYIPIKKRLFMTATERLVSPRLKSIIDNSEDVIFSMDDESKYGTTLSSLTFGEAIEQNIINDYKIIVSAITENDLFELVNKHKIVSSELGDLSSSSDINNLLKELIVGKVMKELEVKKIISFHSSIKNAKSFVQGSNSIMPVGDVIDSMMEDTTTTSTYTNHINGTMSAAERKEILTDFSNSERGLISNARCLTEGVDVPAIDGVFFADPKNSMVDIVQAVGRALRKSKDKENDCSYIIIPIVVPNDASLFSHIEPSAFDTLHNVIQAMRSQDSRMADIIDEINFSAATGNIKNSNKSLNSKMLFLPYSKININDFENSLSLRVAEINKNPADRFKEISKNEHVKDARKSSFKRVFVSLGDYTINSFYSALVKPTIEKYSFVGEELDIEQIRINHNNVSHTVRFGGIMKNGKKYTLTSLGEELKDEKNLNSISKEQLLKYHSQNKDNNEILFPYRALFKIFLEYTYLTRFEFLYCVYTLKSTNDDAIREAIERIQYLRDTYPNIDILSEANKEKVLDILNTKYDVHFSYKDIWTSRTTTYNQFNYFKKHLQVFDNIFCTDQLPSDKEKIQINSGMQPSIKELLDLTNEIEVAAKEDDKEKLEQLYCSRISNLNL